MYLIRENGEKGSPHFQEIKNDSTRDGIMMFFPELSVAKWFAKDGMAERGVIYWCLENFIQPDKVFLDIGAHVGTYTLVCAPRALRTYAFECSPKTFCYLSANLALHGLEDKVSPMSCALGDKEGSFDYIIRSKDGGGNGIKSLNQTDTTLPKIKVQVRTLDSFSLDSVGFIKMDVEGAELEVLKGARETLERFGPPILFESWGEWKTDVDAKGLRTELFNYLTKIGYKIQPISGVRDTFLATKT